MIAQPWARRQPTVTFADGSGYPRLSMMPLYAYYMLDMGSHIAILFVSLGLRTIYSDFPLLSSIAKEDESWPLFVGIHFGILRSCRIGSTGCSLMPTAVRAKTR